MHIARFLLFVERQQLNSCITLLHLIMNEGQCFKSSFRICFRYAVIMVHHSYSMYIQGTSLHMVYSYSTLKFNMVLCLMHVKILRVSTSCLLIKIYSPPTPWRREHSCKYPANYFDVYSGQIRGNLTLFFRVTL